MKKSVVILIAIIYVAAIALVSFFGLQYKVFEEIISVERIEILNSGLKDDGNGGKYIVIYPDENGDRRFQIEYRVYPDNATDNSIEFSYDKQNKNVTVDEFGVVSFDGSGSVKVWVIARDGSAVSASITIIAR